MNITVWNEYRHEKESEKVRLHYPEGIHKVIADFLEGDVTTATLDMPEHGLTEEVLNRTDVLIWWGHKAHDEVSDEIVEKVHQRILEGMGFIALHSAHFSKVFKKLMGTGCDLKWREAGEKERIWVINPAHPIAEGLPEYFELEEEEMYGEHFDIPAPDELLFLSWFEGGEVFRSGATFTRGNGKIFYFRPGHETYPTYHNEYVQKVIKNAVNWVKPTQSTYPTYGNHQPIESIQKGE
ncbi:MULTISPECIES: ThuA domain-containing protein [Macrococcoides]|uniref:Trehalose utilization protein ThuA n=2 Tax=Macrococcoides TaxID=3076173 RepID=A0A328A490_9STAP|nr:MULTISPECIES: trehalose utilization protein ThuA [Macrococcus]ATD31119.1 trehalose utilization protein ThuA [Macrococcus sp. IME1552]MBC9874870.1 trehalose utilization protein ThuA [Macrococcus bohemicus]PKE19532.1 trehalose utilization protein ThuA [Macrococcus caseolyticus]PKF41043.1 trehalose utilization protein ThuA [Macrococcus caseolyticus]QYA35733.1 trehalose utilization protein ThuA [Macrococcus caseolyticus]